MGIQKNAFHEFRSLDEITTTMTAIIDEFPQLAAAEMAITELLVNAVEHGILGISYEEKSCLLEKDSVLDEINRRMQDEKFARRTAFVEVREFSDETIVFVCDDGDGFSWHDCVDEDFSAKTGFHGRGIGLCQAFSRTLAYLGKGNKVIAVFGNDQEPPS